MKIAWESVSPDVLASVLLGSDPARRACPKFDLRFTSRAGQAPAERAQGDHDAVGVDVRRGSVTGAIAVLQHADAFVLHDHSIQVGVGDYGIAFHRRRIPTAQGLSRPIGLLVVVVHGDHPSVRGLPGLPEDP